ncbi:histidine phosphatase family protein [Metasolibacillus meyeri]|uniref:Histidine phosphatase family protein n=1 Tax=Metasolibacillus meyeri TaxID=1071052 RepID=A0AAW9NWG6_9BACL|nr:histidine phosphatase family protein [Metasolibacillus meyeri]MEC1180733.1 histidine phosphatase family protein [Metasolibacillus meyeri]
MTTIGFIRHGITAWNKEGREQGRLDIPLHQEGILAAQQLAQRLATEQWDAIFTSPLARALQTAEIIAQQYGNMPLRIDERLCEIATGLIEGTTEQERIAKWGVHWRNLELSIEPEQEIITRCQSFLDDVKRNFPTERILLVSHGDLLQRLFQLLGYSLPRVHNTSLTIIEQTKSENKLLLFNCMEY